ncbi:MAG: LamG domain-containing protein [Myxococcota bacterium]|nr:LamG domain-containing protein [Myxococcota bacterium]
MIRAACTLAALGCAACYRSHAVAPDASLADESGLRDVVLAFDGPGPDTMTFDADSIEAGALDGGRRDGGRRDASPGEDGGRVSIALRFEPTTWMSVADGPSLDLVRELTLEAWLRVRAGASGLLAYKGDARGGRVHYYVELRDGSEIAMGFVTPAGPRLLRAALVPERWTHVAWTYRDRGDGRAEALLLVDGSLVHAEPVAADLLDATNDQPLVVGRTAADLDEIRIWDVARDPGSIAASARTRIAPGTPGLLAYWPLEERGQVALDRTLRGHDAVLGALTGEDASDPMWIDDGAL